MRLLIFLQFLLCFISSAAMACQPFPREILADTPARVKANFDDTQFVVIAYVVSVKSLPVKVSSASDPEMAIETATFRVERSFKGKLKPGAIFTIDSGTSLCGRGIYSGQWIPFHLGKRSRRSEYPKRWLIYYTPPVMSGPGSELPPFEFVSPLSRPVQWARYDIDVLKKFSGHWTDGREAVVKVGPVPAQAVKKRER